MARQLASKKSNCSAKENCKCCCIKWPDTRGAKRFIPEYFKNGQNDGYQPLAIQSIVALPNDVNYQ
jgi:hypothetical protein